MQTGCSNSFDCVVNSTVAKECYERNNFREDTFFCDCSSWYGWVGENCDKPTSTVYYLRFIFFVLAFWSLFNLVTLFRTLFFFLKYNFDRKTAREANPIFYVIILEIMATLGFFLVRFLDAPSHFDSTLFTISADADRVAQGADVEVKNVAVASALFLVLSILLHFFASTVIILSWLQVFNNMSKIFQPDNETISEKTIQRLIIGTIVLFTLIYIILSSIRAVRVGSFLLIPTGAILLCIAYTVGYLRFRLKMNQFLNGSLGEKQKGAVRIVKRSCLINAFCLIMLMLSASVALNGLGAHLEVLKIGSFNYFLLFLDTAFAMGMLSITYTSYYVCNVNRRLIQRKLTANITWIPLLPYCLSSSRARSLTDIGILEAK